MYFFSKKLLLVIKARGCAAGLGGIFMTLLVIMGVISIYLFYLFIHLFMFPFTEPFGSSVTGAQRGLGVRGLQLDYGLGRPVGCSSTLGCDCSCSSWAPWAPSLHL